MRAFFFFLADFFLAFLAIQLSFKKAMNEVNPDTLKILKTAVTTVAGAPERIRKALGTTG